MENTTNVEETPESTTTTTEESTAPETSATETTTEETSTSTEEAASTENTTETEESTETTEETTEEVTPEATTQDVDIESIEQEFYENNGEVSEETLEALYKQFPKDLVDRYFANAKATFDVSVAEMQTAAYDLAGGEAGFKAMVTWAAEALTPEEIGAYDNAVNGDIHSAKLAIQGLKVQYDAANKSEPKLIKGGNSDSSVEANGYESRAQHLADVNDVRYEKDPAFRAEVRRKLANTRKRGGFN
jgi:Phage T7 capsid assembly protein